jgi:hypothetical protein
MKHASDHIRTARFILLVAIRGIAFIMLLFGSISLLYVLIAGWPHYHSDVEGWALFWIVGIAPGVALLVANRRIIRWLVPMPRRECPDCGYDIENLKSERCPECGCPIAAEGSEPPAKDGGS